MLRNSVILSLVFLPFIAMSQGTINNLFVNSIDNIVRLDFSNGDPTLSYLGFGSGAGIGEGIAHVEDASGQAVILVNSSGVYDRSGTKMPGSTGILAHPSSTEIVICRKPGSPGLYYVIYNNQLCSSLMYSVVDLSKRNGLGDVIELNRTLDPGNSYAEGLEIIGIPCSMNFILVAYRCYQGLVKFEITPDGFTPSKLIQPLNTNNHGGRGELDYRKGKLGYGITFTNKGFFADFDPGTGILSNPELISFPATNGIYGLEFSAEASKVYVSDLDNRDIFGQVKSANLFCYSFETGNISSWTLSNQSQNCSNGDPQGLGQIEIGRDHKLYIPVIGGCTLYVIDQADANPVIQRLETSSVLSAGISDHIKSEFLGERSSPQPFIHTSSEHLVLCKNETIRLEIEPDPLLKYQWHFNGMPIQGETHHELLAQEPGEYKVYVTDQNDCSMPSSPALIEASSLKPVDLGRDTVLCHNTSLQLIIGNNDADILWSDGDTAPHKTVIESGDFHVEVNKEGCIERDSIHVEIAGAPGDHLVPNVITPNGDTFNEHLTILDNSGTSVQIKIFNRWGEEVFSSIDYQNEWNCTALPGGVYYYEVKTSCVYEKGWVHVLK